MGGGGDGGRFSQHKALEPREVDSGNDRSSLAEPEAAACVGPLWLECALSSRQSPALTMPVDEGLEVTQHTQVLLCDEQLRQLSLTPGCSQTFPVGSRKLNIQAVSLLMQPGETRCCRLRFPPLPWPEQKLFFMPSSLAEEALQASVTITQMRTSRLYRLRGLQESVIHALGEPIAALPRKPGWKVGGLAATAFSRSFWKSFCQDTDPVVPGVLLVG